MCTFKHGISRQSTLIFLKLQNLATYVTDVMMDAMPEVKHIYMYRQPVSFVRSYEKLYYCNNWKPVSGEEASYWSGLGQSEILKDYPIYRKDRMEKLSDFAKLAIIWVTGMEIFIKRI